MIQPHLFSLCLVCIWNLQCNTKFLWEDNEPQSVCSGRHSHKSWRSPGTCEPVYRTSLCLIHPLKLKTVPCQEISFRKNCFLVLFFFPLAALTFEEQRLPTHRSAIIKTKGKNHHNQLSTTIRLWGMSMHCFGEHRWGLPDSASCTIGATSALSTPLWALWARQAEIEVQHHKSAFDGTLCMLA